MRWLLEQLVVLVTAQMASANPFRLLVQDDAERCSRGRVAQLEMMCDMMMGMVLAEPCPQGTARFGCTCKADARRCLMVWEPLSFDERGSPVSCPCRPLVDSAEESGTTSEDLASAASAPADPPSSARRRRSLLRLLSHSLSSPFR